MAKQERTNRCRKEEGGVMKMKKKKRKKEKAVCVFG